VFDGREGLQAKHQLPAQSDARHRSPLAVDEDPAAQSLGVGRQNPIRSIGDVNLPNLAWLPEMDVHVQWVLAIFGELICVRQLHVFLPAVRREQYALAVANDPEMRMVSGCRGRRQQNCRRGKRNDQECSA
jgi:hypothetical protein